MGKIIVFTNVKGGVGKTLMCSYLQVTSHRKADVLLLSMQTSSSLCLIIVRMTFRSTQTCLCLGRLSRSQVCHLKQLPTL